MSGITTESLDMAEPTLDQVIAFVREFTGTPHRTIITASTRIEEDLGVCGLDGVDLLERVEKHFGIEFPAGDGVRIAFELAPHEYLFSSDGFDLPILPGLLRWLKGTPRPVVVDLTVGRLREVLARLKAAPHER